jgi:PAS domain S-box-containing protein
MQARNDPVEVGTAANDDEIEALRAIVEGTARNTGDVFFQSLVRHLATAVGVGYAFVAEFAQLPARVRTIANWGHGRIIDNVEYDLAGTPCEDVVRGGLCHHPQRVREKFPDDQYLIDHAIESYLGVPLVDGDGRVLGHLAIYDERPMPAEPRWLFIFRIFAARAAAELERLRVEQQLVESERRYRDLYEEAPNAYVAIGNDRRLMSVNHRATQLLGTPARDLVGRPVLSLFADTSAGKPRAVAALDSGFAGDEISGIELEMHRDDSGPLWNSLWMRPLKGTDARIHAVHSIWVDVRIIAATNRDLMKAIRDQTFREDLYYRLNVFPITLPPLRDRAPDIPLLARFMIGKFAARVGTRIETVSQETMRRLVAYRWPGNIRELENVLERAVILATGPTLEIEIHAELPIGTAAPTEDVTILSLEAVERRHILAVLERTQWIIDGPRGAAAILGLHANTLRSRLKKRGIHRSSHEPS